MSINGKEYKNVIIKMNGLPIESVSEINYTVDDIEQIRSQVPYVETEDIDYEGMYNDPFLNDEKQKVNFITGLLIMLHLK